MVEYLIEPISVRVALETNKQSWHETFEKEDGESLSEFFARVQAVVEERLDD